MRSLISTLVGVMALVAITATAEAKIVQYRSKHPLPRKIGHGFCYIDVPHVHDFGPSDPRLYREVNGEYYFVGDPAPFDYEGPRYSFYGPHPVVEADVQLPQPVYCYLKGPHYHYYQPPSQAPFELKGGAYWYTGNFDPVYYQDRPRYQPINEVYAPIDYPRPVVDVSVAPPSFHGEIVAAPGVVRAGVGIAGPAVSAGVYIAPPPPPEVRVGINIGGPPLPPAPPPVVIEERREIYEVHDHHDHGRHEGWYKQGHEEHGWRHEEHDRGWRPEDHGHGGWRPEEHGHGGWRQPPPQQHAPAAGGWRPAPAPAHKGPPQHHEGWR
jgi:hypothetical protein